MNRWLTPIFTVLIAFLIVAAVAQDKPSSQVTFPFFVYKDGGAKENRYFASGFTGDYSAIKMDEKCKETPKAGESCVKFTYTGETPQNLKWAGVFFQNPANNWGTIDGGYDLTGAKKLTFFARGEKGGEVVEFKFGGVSAAYSDSAGASTGPIVLTKEWKEYQIPLEDQDLSYVLTGFTWVAEQKNSPDGQVFYLDEIAYVNDDLPK
jgi:hypothetical protein